MFKGKRWKSYDSPSRYLCTRISCAAKKRMGEDSFSVCISQECWQNNNDYISVYT